MPSRNRLGGNFSVNGTFKLYKIKENVSTKSNIKFRYCSTDHLNSLRELIFLQILVIVKEILPSNNYKTLK